VPAPCCQRFEPPLLSRQSAEWLGEDLGFQGVEKELASLPGSYAADKGGAMLLAYAATGGSATQQCIGAVALRRLAGHTPTLGEGDCLAGVPLGHVCEMKRLFVLDSHHGLGAGAALTRALLGEAARLGYRLMVCDTLERLQGANRLYARLGFQPCERYNDCPLPGVLYFARRLDDAA
jgi:GNAT superfamily N-acetyltransferase